MSLETILRRIRDAFDTLNRRDAVVVGRPAPRERAGPHAEASPAAPALRPGFTTEALPWLSAVHRFALRLSGGDEDRAADLTQETFLKAYRAWESFERGTNCRSWLFTICKNTHLKVLDEASVRHEVRASDPGVEAMAVVDVHDRARCRDLDGRLFERALDDHIVEAIDALPEEYRDVLVLSDLGDLNYAEISQVLDIPVGTVKSRLFRARRRLQDRLVDHAIEAGIIEDAHP